MPTPRRRKGEDPHQFVRDTLGLTKADLETIRDNPDLLTKLGGVAMKLIQLHKDIEIATTRADSMERRAAMAEIDPLTGLLMRGPFLRAAADMEPSPSYMAIFLDVRGLKAVNDNIGHKAGDGLLKAVAEALIQKGVRQGSVVGRWGGDEFAAVVPVEGNKESAAVAERLNNMFNSKETAEIFQADDETKFYLSARFGYQLMQTIDAASLEEVLLAASNEMQLRALQENHRGSLPPRAPS